MTPHLGLLEQATLSYRWTHPDPRMDRLQEAVATLVAQAAEREEEAPVTFDKVRRLADESAGAVARPAIADSLPANRPRPPRLTEAWFC